MPKRTRSARVVLCNIFFKPLKPFSGRTRTSDGGTSSSTQTGDGGRAVTVTPAPTLPEAAQQHEQLLMAAAEVLPPPPQDEHLPEEEAFAEPMAEVYYRGGNDGFEQVNDGGSISSAQQHLDQEEEKRQQFGEIDTTPTTSSAAAAGGAKIQNYAEQTPSPPAKLFELAQCEKEMRQIAAKWNLLFSEEFRGFYLFMPPRDTKALKEGVLLSLTDRGDHIRMDEFHAFVSQEDRTQRWPKERGQATIMCLASDQCARMFATSS